MPIEFVVPVDASAASLSALPFVRALAKITGSGLTLLAVIDTPGESLMVPQDSSDHRMSERAFDRQALLFAEQEEYHSGIAASIQDSPVDYRILSGSPATKIIEFAESLDDPCIVMSSHGRSGIGRLLLASVTKTVVQRATCPVIIVRASERGASVHTTKKIDLVLIPLDGSKYAETASHAVEHLTGDHARIQLLNIVSPISDWHSTTPQSVVEYENRAFELAEDYLDEITDSLRDRRFRVETTVRGDAPARGIVDAAEEMGADLIAISTNGRSGIERFILGSVAERVIREATSPVLVVHPVQRRSVQESG